MTLSLSTTGNLQSMSRIVIAKAVANVEPAAPMMDLVARYDIEKGSFQVSVPLWNRMTALSLTEGIDLASPQVIAATIRTLTGTRHGLMTFVSDRLKDQNNENVISEVGVQHGNAVGRLLDGDLLTLIDGFGLTAPGAGNAATFLHITGAIAGVRTNTDTTFGPAPSKPVAVLHPEQIRLMVQEATGMQAGGTTMSAQPIPVGLSEDVIKAYWRGNDPLFGVPIIEDVNIVLIAGNDAKGGVFARQALALAMEQEMKGEEQRDASLFGTEIVTSDVHGETELVDAWGREIFSKIDPVFS